MRFCDKLREMKGELSEAALAAAAGLPYATVHNYILGRRLPGYGAVVKLAAALGTDCRAFVGCEDLAGEPAKKPARKSGKTARKRPAK